MVADDLDPARLDGLVAIGVDEVSWRRRHRHLTLLTRPHREKDRVGRQRQGRRPLDECFADISAERADRADRLQAISMDMGAAFNKSAPRERVNATRCIDPYDCVQLVAEALDVERRKAWN